MVDEKICEVSKCMGCSACATKCPMHCITMTKDTYGFERPVIDKKKCVSCNLCRQVCPVNEPVAKKKPDKTYAAWALDENQHKTSMSGGVGAVLAEQIVKNGGIAAGAIWEEPLKVSHVLIDQEGDLKGLKGSKYVQSHMGSTFLEVEEKLKTGKNVIFFGTPCQCAGMKKCFHDRYENLWLVDIICHGVPSQQFLQDAVHENIGDQPFDQLLFRDRKGYALKLYQGDQLLYNGTYQKASFARAFLYGLNCRDSCYSCDYTCVERCSDITIGDFWGLGRKKPFDHVQKDGTSVVMVNTSKGQKLLQDCEKELFLEERELEEAVEGNTQLREPQKRHKSYKTFMDLYPKVGYQKALKKAFGFEIYQDLMKRIIKKMLGMK